MDKESFLSVYKAAGYSVVDSFAYDDIKNFLMQHKPGKLYLAVYTAVLLVVSFFIGFLIVVLWKEAATFSQFLEKIFLCLSFSLLGGAIIIPIHEFIHWLAYKNEGAADVRFGAIWKSFVFYAAAHNFVADYPSFRRVALAPFLILLGLLALVFLFPIPLWGRIAVLFILFFHLSCCSGDFMMLSYMRRNRTLNLVTVDDIENRVTYFMKK